MILLAIFGGLMLLLSIFYLLNSWQRYGQWKWATFLVLLSAILTGVGTWGALTGHHRTSSSPTTSRQATAQTATSSLAVGNQAMKTAGADQSSKENALLGQLQKAYGKLGTVGFDQASKTYQIKPAAGDEQKALQAVLDDPSQAEQIGWPKLTKSLQQTSAQLKEILGAGYSLSLMAPNSDQAMYTVKDGQETFTAVK